MNQMLLEKIKGLFVVKNERIEYSDNLGFANPHPEEGFRGPLFMLRGLAEILPEIDPSFPVLIEKKEDTYFFSEAFKRKYGYSGSATPDWRYNQKINRLGEDTPGFCIPGFTGDAIDNLAVIAAWQQHEHNRPRGYDPLGLILDHLSSHKKEASIIDVSLLGAISPSSFLWTLSMVNSIIVPSLGRDRICRLTVYDISEYPLRLIESLDSPLIDNLFPYTHFQVETRRADLTDPGQAPRENQDILIHDILSNYLTRRGIDEFEYGLNNILSRGGIVIQRTLSEPKGSPPPIERYVGKDGEKDKQLIGFLKTYFPHMDLGHPNFLMQYNSEIENTFSGSGPVASNIARNGYMGPMEGMCRNLSFFTSRFDPNTQNYPRIFNTRIGLYN